MDTYAFKCQICGSPFSASRANATQCSGTCRQAAYRARQAHNRLAADLLRKQTRAIIAGSDPAVMAGLAREAEALFGSV